MSLAANASRLFRGVLRTPLVSAAKQVATKPPKHPITPLEQGIALTTLFATILGPSGWILCHLEDYKTRQ
ncbi:cytochrome c oxidase subunit 8B, mitochondrial [Solea solea]|uniref:cytochrome c oxidase subunit 8B, mitochondrial n=1 Tax=Solea solea TaxID=90069 RepID=UPI00272C5922|nr:cytochrome c oxidase subunit 8B, mitochondrial [Solea solea]